MNFFDYIVSLWQALFTKPATTTTTTELQPDTTTSTTTRGDGNMKMALCLGINDYPGTGNDLSGCVPDANNWASYFKDDLKFDNVTTLFNNQVISRAFVDDIFNKFSVAKAGDLIVISYSGHGSSVRDLDGDEADGRDETLCFHDRNYTDDELRNLFNKKPNGVKLVFLSDSCHSGTVTRSFMRTMSENEYVKPKYMPPEDDIEAALLMAVPANKAIGYVEDDMNHILISGTNAATYSYDARINGQATGAFTYYSLKVLRENGKMTYNEFINKLSAYLPSSRYPQYPQLEGNIGAKNSLMFE